MGRILLALAMGATLALAVGVGSAGAGAGIEEFPVSISLSSATCSQLPPGTTVTGEGTLKSVTTVVVVGGGLVRIQNTSIATGTAADQAGNVYVWTYSNQFRVTNSAADPVVFTGTMTDAFSLAGGPAGLTNGFVATFTTDFDTLFQFEPSHVRGDPIDFATGATHCDPL